MIKYIGVVKGFLPDGDGKKSGIGGWFKSKANPDKKLSPASVTLVAESVAAEGDATGM